MQINLSLDLPSFLTYGGFSRDGRLNRGLYNLTGRDLTLSRTIAPVQMDSGTFTLTGNTLSTGAIVGLDTGSFSITGNDYRVDYGISLDSGSFVLTGNTLATGLVVGLDTGSFSLTGNNFSSAYEINLDPNSFSLTGNNLTESVVRASVDFDTGSFSLTGNDLMVTLVALTVDMDAGSFSLTGNDLTTGGGAFTPADLFASSEAGFWISARDTVYSDTGGTTSASVGGTVARLDDKTANGNNFAQATTADQAILREVSGLRQLEFDAVGDEYLLTLELNGSRWTYIGVYIPPGPEAGTVLIHDSTGPYVGLAEVNTSTTRSSGATENAVYVDNVAVSGSTRTDLLNALNAGNVVVYDFTVTTPWPVVEQGKFRAGARSVQGNLIDVILINRELTSGERADIQTYYGAILP